MENDLKEHFLETKSNVLNLLEKYGYKKSTIASYVSLLDEMYEFLFIINQFSFEIDNINKFYESIEENSNYCQHTKSQKKAMIRRVIDLMNGDFQLAHPRKKEKCIYNAENKKILDSYISSCRAKGNKESTLQNKNFYLSEFIYELEQGEPFPIVELNSDLLIKVLSGFDKRRTSNAFPCISAFLKYLFEIDVLERDFSLLIPIIKRHKIFPQAYSEQEIKAIEDIIDCSTFKGKRDKAAILLASRLGIRASDIVNLKESDIDFVQNRISFYQMKTNSYISLFLPNDVKEALQNYLEARHEINSNTDFIFIRTISPYTRLTRGSAINYALCTYFKNAGIDITNKKHGLHSLRSSLASSMVNDGISYNIVRNVLGHTDPNAISHYVKLDINQLRKYALEVPKPSGKFAEFLNGGLKDGI